jgi:hypothetical protein
VKTLALLALLLPQARPAAPPKVDPARVDAAIRKGAEFLKSRPDFGVKKSRRDELVLLTLLHAGVPESDPKFRELLARILETPLERTYNAALQAMILEELDRVKYQTRIWQCAQFLVDNQCRNGQWSYGKPTAHVDEVPTGTPVRSDTASGGKARGKVRDFEPPGARQKPKVVRKLPVTQKRTGPDGGDNSNTQYAALGLRACHDAGIVFPKDVIALARKWWVESQHDPEDPKEAYPARGWSYDEKGDFHPYGSMTAGAAGGLLICDYILEENWKHDRAAQAGLAWIAKRFTVAENPGPPEKHGGGLNHYYYLYALERLGVLASTEFFGPHEWYPAGAELLLGAQQADGSWKVDDEICDTCYAILFLRRATRPLDVATGGGRR